MRLKLLGVLLRPNTQTARVLGTASLIMVLLCTMAAASVSQLTSVGTVAQGDTTTLTLQASGAYTHNEYRPTDSVLLLDLTGVTAGTLQDQVRSVDLPGLKSYHVKGFLASGDVPVVRIELALVGRPEVRVNETKDGLVVQVTAAPGTAAASVKAASATAAQHASTVTPQQAYGSPAKIRKVSVVRGKQGMELEVTGSAPLVAKALKLSAPDRIVLDIANAVPVGRPRPIMVNAGDVKTVRMARYQLDPPITRVVVDLAAAHDYEVVPSGSKLVLKLRAATAAPAPAPAMAVLAKPGIVQPPAKGAEQPAKDYVFVEPAMQPKKDAVAAEPRLLAANAGPATTSALASALQTPSTPPPPPVRPATQSPVNFAAEQQQQAQTPATPPRPRYTGEPISVNLKDVDLKDFFRLIHEISGLNVVLDPNVAGSLTLVLDDVPWDQALDIVLKNNGLERQLEGNVLRISTLDNLRKEAEARRKQIEAQALAVDKVTTTRFLSYAHSKDVLPTIKRLLSSRGEIVADDRTNALIISDIPSVMPAIDNLLAQLDRKTQQVEIEARVVAATRNFARDIGTQLGFGVGSRATAVGGLVGQASAASPIAVSGHPAPYIVTTPPAGAGSSGGVSIPLFSNLAAVGATSGLSLNNLGSNYRLDVILSALETRGLAKILSRPRVITQNNIQAIVKQGTRIPVVTAAQLGGPPTTSYVEAVLRLTVTPQITVENTIFLNVDIENTTPGPLISGVPELLTQQATTQVLVTNGGTVVIGGVIQTQNSNTVDQVPLLGSIPGLGNLFKRRATSSTTQELIFFITPRIVET